MNITLLGNLPSDEIFQQWSNTIADYYGVQSTPDEIKLAFLFSLGYRTANNMRYGVEEPYKSAVNAYRNHYDKWSEDNSDTDSRESVWSALCLLKFGMKPPTYGDSAEYIEKFKTISGVTSEV